MLSETTMTYYATAIAAGELAEKFLEADIKRWRHPRKRRRSLVALYLVMAEYRKARAAYMLERESQKVA